MSKVGALPTKTVGVSQLGGTKVSYHLPKPIVGSKPTLILINAFIVDANFFRPQVTDEKILDEVNIVAFEPLGHGNTSTASPTFTYWDSAEAFLQAMDALSIKKAFVLGCSQGGWIAVRMALIAPTRVTGIISISSNMSDTGPRFLELGNMDMTEGILDNINKFSSPDPNFKLPSEVVKSFAPLSLGPSPKESDVAQFLAIAERVYVGEAGRQKFRQANIALQSRDSLHLRLDAVIAPVLWIRGSDDPIFSEKSAKEDISKLVNSKVTLKTVQGAWHAPSWTNPDKVNELVVAFIKKTGGKVDARALREAVGMVDI